MSDQQTAAMLDRKLDEQTAHTMFVCGIVMTCAALVHDGARDLGAEPDRVYLPRRDDLPCQEPAHVRDDRRRNRGHLYARVVPHAAPVRLGDGTLGRVELLILRSDEGRYLSGTVLSGR